MRIFYALVIFIITTVCLSNFYFIPVTLKEIAMGGGQHMSIDGAIVIASLLAADIATAIYFLSEKAQAHP